MESVATPQQDPAFQFATYATNVTYDRLPSEVIAVLKRIVLDTLGTTLAGVTLGSGCQEIVDVVRAAGGAGEATLLGFGDRLPALNAALANGAMAHALNYDDVYGGGGHLGVVTLPAALAVAERQGGVGGKELLAALAAGVEVKARSGQLYRARVDKPLGDPSKPLSEAQLRGKFLDCATHAPVDLSDATLEEIVERIDHLEDEADVGALASLVSGGDRPRR